jgi:hypothetical protein
MADLFNTMMTVSPSYMMPEILLQQQQASGAFYTLADKNPLVRLSNNDRVAYVKRFDIRTQISVGQNMQNELPGVNINASLEQTAAYLLQVRSTYNSMDMADAAVWGASLPEAQRLGRRQAIYQELRNMLLYGKNPTAGEGLLNNPNSTYVNLPPDSNGNDTVLTYDNGEMATFLLQQVLSLKQTLYQLGFPSRVVILGPQRVLGQLQYPNIVQLTQYQRQGAGTMTTSGVVTDVLDINADSIEWCYDDTLEGKGAGGTDAILLVIPEIVVPESNSMVNTNEFARLTPNLRACTLMLADMAAPLEITYPIGEATGVVSQYRSTSGWAIRPEAVQVISMQYS